MTALTLVLQPLAASAAPISSGVIWVWSGAITPESAVVTAKLALGTNGATLLLRPAIGGANPLPDATAKPDQDGIVRFEVKGLSPGTEYQYTVRTERGASPEGRLQTFRNGPMSFRIGFASCATTGSNHRIFDALRQLDLLLFIHMGDFHYEDIRRNDTAMFHRAYDRVLTSPRQGAFYRATPIAYVWDDHDFGPNDSDRTSPSRPAALKTYQQCVPHYPLFPVEGGTQTIQQAFTIGRVRFLFTDPRAQRSPQNEPDGPEKSMLGKAQRAWLLSELESSSDYSLVVWVNGVPWITKNSPGRGHGWEPYSWERTLIADTIKQSGLVERMLMLSGDAHMVAADDGTNSNYASGASTDEAGFPVFQAAPLDRFPRTKGGPYSQGISAPRKWFPLLKARQFGLMELKDDGTRIIVELTGRDADGDVLPGMVLRMECSESGCVVVR